ncbi:MAG TPA: DUF4132 domain-containing protein, partial [Verrucomicrobiota bacterium]|nr:DUF4132 domain-containing protein [Verrucomicrobiota bacterium]
MALEQLRAFRREQSLAELGPTELLAPDNYPLLQASDLREEHSVVSRMLELSQGRVFRDQSILQEQTFAKILESDKARRTRLCLALIERTFAYDAKLSRVEGFAFSNFFGYGQAANAMATLFDRGVEEAEVALLSLEWFNCYRFNHYATPLLKRVLAWIAANHSAASLPAELRDRLITLDGQLRDGGHPPSDELRTQVEAILGEGPWSILPPVEVWAEAALAQVQAEPEVHRNAWLALLKHCGDARSARPSGKWLKNGMVHLKSVGAERFAVVMLDWFPRVDVGRKLPTLGMCWENVDERQQMNEVNATVLRGLLWLCTSTANPDLVRAIGRLATSGYRKVRGLGPRAVKVGNAAVYALSEVGTPEAVGQLALLKAHVKFGTALKEIEKAYTTTATKLGLAVDEIEEMAVPAYGLTGVGVCEEPLGEFTARLTVAGDGSTEVIWLKADGKPQKSVPAAVKAAHAAELKELQAAAKDIQRMLPAQRERLDGLFLAQKSWPLAVWRERYLDHPLVGVLARRLIWEFTTNGRTTAGMWLAAERRPPARRELDSRGQRAGSENGAPNGTLADLDLRPAPLDDTTVVRLCHPIGKDVEEVLAWRGRLESQQIRQPFKQAHREVYVLTDAERNTRTYSNRFAAHILRRPEFNALCAARGGKTRLRLMVEPEFPPASRTLPQWGLRAEFWIEGVGDNYGTDTAESGAFLRVATDQVRFHRLPADRHDDVGDPVSLDQIPLLVFSEIMRDVDLFVGVASVGNDPTWNDGGPEGRFRDYWQSYSFGDLSATAQTRKAVLEKLVPRLKIADRCSFADKFLVVRGQVRSYKIHLGSGNIL